MNGDDNDGAKDLDELSAFVVTVEESSRMPERATVLEHRN